MAFKYFFLLLSLLGTLSVSLQAQFSLSAVAGPSWATGTRGTQNTIKTGGRVGHFLGLEPSYGLHSKWSLQSGVYFSESGFAIELEPGIKPQAFYSRVRTLDIIPELHFKPHPNFSLGAGVCYAIELQESWSDYQTNSNWAGVVDHLKPSDLKLSCSAVFQFRNYKVFVRYLHGLTNRLNVMFTDEFGNDSGYAVKSRMAQLGIGYSFF